MSCLKAKCTFWADGANQYRPGARLASTKDIKGTCRVEGRTWFENGCPSKFGFLAVLIMGLYIISYSPGMGTVPWIVNSEIYPLRYRGTGRGIADVSNRCSNLIASETFLTLTQALGSAGTFLLFEGVSPIGLIFIYFLVRRQRGFSSGRLRRCSRMVKRPRYLGERPTPPRLLRNPLRLII